MSIAVTGVTGVTGVCVLVLSVSADGERPLQCRSWDHLLGDPGDDPVSIHSVQTFSTDWITCKYLLKEEHKI